MRPQAPLFWTPQAEGIVKNFEQKYKVTVYFNDAFGVNRKYPGGPVVYPASDSKYFDNARVAALGEAYSTVDGYYGYATIFWNAEGEMYQVFVYIEIINAPEFC